ncbi:hypothetical protein HHI36_009671, partial [Cryptolaemus montrouzieri]
MKRRLQETVQYYQSKIDELEKDEEQIYNAYELWLEEPRLHESNLLLPSLPPQYEANLLFHIIQGDAKPWYEYIDYKRVKQEQQECIRIWRISNFRENTNVNRPLPNSANSMESDNPVERIFRRLTSYDAPKPAPEIGNAAAIVPTIDIGSLEAMFNMLKPNFDILTQFA